MKIEARSKLAKRLWHVLRAAYYMLQKCISKQKLIADLHLRFLIERSDIAGKANSYYSSITCRSVDPIKSFYTPREVEFSCSNTLYDHCTTKRRNYIKHDVAAVAKAFEMLNSEMTTSMDEGFVLATPSPMPVRQVRVTDSPFCLKEEEGEGGGWVDKEAEEFIRRFL